MIPPSHESTRLPATTLLLIADTHVPNRARDLPEVAHVELDGVRLAVVHETGASMGRDKRCAAQFPDTDVLVFGHSHIPWDTTTDTGLRLLNPGSPTDRRRQPHHTLMTAEINDNRLTDVRLHRLGAGTATP